VNEPRLGKRISEAPQWARVRGDANYHIRRGAWYEVVRLTPDAVVLDVNRQPVTIGLAAVQIVPVRPERWSVVPRPPDAVNLPLSWGSRYAVCPACRDRAPLKGQRTELVCSRCHGVFPVAWDDPF
jgi:hypothetical protein